MKVTLREGDALGWISVVYFLNINIYPYTLFYLPYGLYLNIIHRRQHENKEDFYV